MTKPSIHEIHKEYYIYSDLISVILVHQYNTTLSQWKFSGYRCKICGAHLRSIKGVDKHPSICKTINTTKKRKDKEVPIQVVTKNGERYYRWGDSGKLYKDRSDAEKQAHAAYASGYRESNTSRDNNAERAGRQVTRDMEYDDTHKPRYETNESSQERDMKAERAGRRITQNIEYDERMRKRK